MNSPHPPLEDLPLYPGAQSVMNQQGKNVSALSTDTISRVAPSVSYHFETTDGSSNVVDFYKGAMEKTYGFVGTNVEQPDRSTTILHFGRSALRDVRVVELVTVTVRSTRPDLTNVELDVHANW
ncbi:MAG TPA: hypothetical protein VLQ48_10675 [Chloroflexia bacterium]|nr:hypothetical protein [Chloroflexia bacterium]